MDGKDVSHGAGQARCRARRQIHQEETEVMSDALSIVKEFFPNALTVKDAKEPITVQVTKGDNNSAKVRDHKACAMAVACKRAEHADGVIVSVMTAYVIKGTTATR